jgi:hypothetical protein
MFSSDDLKQFAQIVRDVVQVQVEAARLGLQTLEEAARLHQSLVQQLSLFQLSGAARPPEPNSKKARPGRRVPWNVRHRTYRDFVLDMQRLQAKLEGEHGKVTKEALARLSYDSARTITRTMQRYGLAPDDWPPKRWDPDRPPQAPE